jgi:PhnB protein
MEFTPYLNFNGQCADAFRFYEKTFGGRIEMMQTHGDSPMKEHVSPDWHDRVLHVCMAVGQQRLMGSDAPPDHYEKPQGLYVTINVPTVTDANRVFTALAEGGRVTMPFDRTFWSPGFGMVVDRFGTPWMVNAAEA